MSNDKYFYRSKRKSNRNNIWNNIVSKTDYRVDIIHKNISVDEAFEIEKELIKKYKRKCDGGTLSNITFGGEGVTGIDRSYCTGENSVSKTKEWKEKMRIANLGSKNPMYGRTGNKHANFGKKIEKSSGGNHYKAKVVIDLSTGIFYNCIKEAAEYNGYAHSSLRNMLNGQKRNKTSLISL
ncbi:hypothetical protein HZP67_09765 [Elizabethkingia anophelis]|nr:hypothetical protein [Elizabethkingia anophelis]MCT4148127.1 hypothetical protein [Elizabethkingia anophelis]